MGRQCKIPIGPIAPAIHAPVSDGGLLAQPKHPLARAARMMGIGATTLRRLVRRGRIPVLWIGGKMLVVERDMEAFLRGCYGTVEEARAKAPGLPPLPERIRDSKYLTKARRCASDNTG